MEKARHVLRVGFVVLLLAGALTLARTFAVPPSYGVAGRYRLDNVAEQRAREVKHQGSASCKGCHEPEYALWQDGEVHAVVQCEVCHGPSSLHVKGDKKIGNARVEKGYQQCLLCHRKLEGRPASIKQINAEKHKNADLTAGDACLKCHNPHSTMFEE